MNTINDIYNPLCYVIAFGIHSIQEAAFNSYTLPSLFIVFPAFPMISLRWDTAVGGSVYQLKKLRFYHYIAIAFALHWRRICHWIQRIQNISLTKLFGVCAFAERKKYQISRFPSWVWCHTQNRTECPRYANWRTADLLTEHMSPRCNYPHFRESHYCLSE